MMASRNRTALNYALIFAANGISLPFAGLWFQSRGLSGAEISVILAVPMLARLITGPMIAVWADGFRYRRTPLSVLALVAALAYGAAGLADGFALWLPLWLVAASCAAALVPLSDVLTLRLSAREGFAFGIPRGVGSAAFVGANVGMGALLVQAPADVIIAGIVISTLLAALAARLVLPPEPVSETGPTRKRDRFAGMGRLVADPVFMTAILAVGTIQATHGFLYAFSAIEWKARGISEAMTGLLWAFSVVVEIVFLWVIDPWRRRRGIGPWVLLMAGGAAAVLRWTALAMMPPLWLLWPLQALHALTFAAVFIAGLELVEKLSPRQHATAAQTLSSTLSSGVLIGLATLLAGPLYDVYGALGYGAMSVMAMLGLLAGWRLRPHAVARRL